MHYKTNKTMKYRCEELWFPLSEDILAWDDDFHELMLNDDLRMQAYRSAIMSVVKPGMVVCDVGTGTGILALWALEAGASKVYGIDVKKSQLANAQKRIHHAGYANQFTAIQGFSYDVTLPERVDGIISEILGNLADNEDMTPILHDARKRFLKEGGFMLPLSVASYLVPITSAKLHNQLERKICKVINEHYNLKLLMQELKISSQVDLYYDAVIPYSSHLSAPHLMQSFRFEGQDQAAYLVERSFEVVQAGLFTGFKGYFVAALAKGVILDISSDNIASRKTSDCWKHCYLPVEVPFHAEVGDVIQLSFSRYYPVHRQSPFRQGYSWKGEIIRGGKRVYSFDQATAG